MHERRSQDRRPRFGEVCKAFGFLLVIAFGVSVGTSVGARLMVWLVFGSAMELTPHG